MACNSFFLYAYHQISASERPLTDYFQLPYAQQIEDGLFDGTFSTAEIDRIKSIIWADGKVTYEELRTVNQTIKEVMGDVVPEMEWRSNT